VRVLIEDWWECQGIQLEQRVSGLHITLLREVVTYDASRTIEEMGHVVSRFPPISVRTSGGSFYGRYGYLGRNVFLSLTIVSDPLIMELQEELSRLAGDVGVLQSYRPHLTVARFTHQEWHLEGARLFPTLPHGLRFIAEGPVLFPRNGDTRRRKAVDLRQLIAGA
jgi:2'-5' RNA ligase